MKLSKFVSSFIQRRALLIRNSLNRFSNENRLTKNEFGFAPIIIIIIVLLVAIGLAVYLVQKEVTFKPNAYSPPEPYPTAITLRHLYVNPNGNDCYDGTSATLPNDTTCPSGTATKAGPWKTFHHVGQNAQAGDMVHFADGTYVESQAISYSLFDQTGTPNARPTNPDGSENPTYKLHNGTGTPGQSNWTPIILKAENKHQAIIRFENTTNNTGFWIQGNDNIVIQDFIMEKPCPDSSNPCSTLAGSTYGDGIMRVVNNPPTYPPSGVQDPAENVYLVGNHFRNSFELVKSTGAPNNVLDGNIFENTATAFGAVLGDSIIFRNNEVRNFTETAFQAKGGTINSQVYNNYVHTNRNNGYAGIGMYIGGNGWESHNNVYFNNVIIGEIPGALDKGVVFQSCINCGFVNNTIMGAKNGISSFQGNTGSFGRPSPYSSSDYLYTKNAVIKNNIVHNCTWGYTPDASYMLNAVVEHNLFNCTNESVPGGSLTGDPSLSADGKLLLDSSAIGAGTTVNFVTYTGPGFIEYPSGITQYVAHPVDLSKDIEGRTRTSPWDLGAYAISTTDEPTVTPTPTTPQAPPVPGTTVNPPTNMTLSSTTNSITVRWTASTTPGVTYKVYRGYVNGQQNTLVATTTDTSYTDPSSSFPQQDAYYWYRVSAVLNGVESSYSNENLIKLASSVTPTVVNPPTNMTLSSTTSSITIKWTASTTPGVTYKLYRGYLPGEENTLVTTTTNTSYTDLPQQDSYYWYRVKAELNGVESGYSNENLIKLVVPTPAPTPVPTPVLSSPTLIEGESMSLIANSGAIQVFSDSNASNSLGLIFYSNATSSKSVNLSSSKTKLTVTARADICRGNPIVVVRVDGSQVLSTQVTANYYLHYTAPLNLPAGTHTISVSYTNDYYSKNCDRNLRVDKIILE